eukprot:24832-Eustigmatos_ZCMA.PRE.1
MAETDEVLFERPLTVGSKRVYVDLRRNAQGVYLKLSEKGPSGKSTVLIPGEGQFYQLACRIVVRVHICIHRVHSCLRCPLLPQ